jgi:two-component system, sensor histidine kinase and response regulator
MLTILIFTYPSVDLRDLTRLSGSMRRVSSTAAVHYTKSAGPKFDVHPNAVLFAGMTFFFAIAFLYSRELWKEEGVKKTLLLKDIAERHRTIVNANSQINSKTQELSRAYQVTDKLFSVISHDLRGPLTSLKGILHLSQQGHISRDEEAVHYKKLQANVDSTLSLLNNLLFWASTQINSLTPIPTRVSLQGMAEESIKLHDWAIQQKNLTVVNLIHDTHLVFADKGMINTVITNLLSNAIKFTAVNGTIKFYSEQDNSKATLCIVDNGIGIPPDVLPNVFMNRITTPMKEIPNETGSGLGLYLSKQLIDLNCGKISVESAVGIGSIFRVELPTVT